MANYSSDFTDAPKDRQLILLVPTGYPDDPIAIELGWWDEDDGRWEGGWRCFDDVGGYQEADPIGWCKAPEIDAEIIAKFAMPAAQSAKLSPRWLPVSSLDVSAWLAGRSIPNQECQRAA